MNVFDQCDANIFAFSGTGNAAQQNSSSSNANYTAPSNGGGLKEANFSECIPTILSPECTLRRKSEALNRVIELAQKSGGLDLVALYKFASLSEIVKTYVHCYSYCFFCDSLRVLIIFLSFFVQFEHS